MKYEILLNGKYINTFKSYVQATEKREQLQKKFPNAKIKIIEKYWQNNTNEIQLKCKKKGEWLKWQKEKM